MLEVQVEASTGKEMKVKRHTIKKVEVFKCLSFGEEADKGVEDIKRE